MLKLFLFIFSFVVITACSEDQAVEKKVASEPSAGELVVKQNCKVCHAQGINGAPIIGNKKMWAPRIVQGKETLIQHAIAGYGLMPAKGGNPELSDDEIALAVNYFISQVK